MWDSSGATLHKLGTSGRFGRFAGLGQWHAKLDAQCGVAYAAFKELLHDNGLSVVHARFSHLTLSMKRKGSNLCMKSKAGAALHVNAWLLSVCEELWPVTLHDVRRASVLWAHNEIFDVYVKGPLSLADADVSRLECARDALFGSLRGLRMEMFRQNIRAWHSQGSQLFHG